MGYNVQGQYLKFAKAVQSVKDGEWGQAEMQSFLQRTANYLKPKGDAIFETLETPGYREEAKDECECAENGVEHYEQGIEEMWAYTQDGNVAHLDKGLKTIKKGNDMLNKAMTINRDAYEELELKFFM